MLITFEGLDGAGKSTLAKEIRSALAADHSFTQWVYQSKEPGLEVSLGDGLKFNRFGPDIRSIVLEDRSLKPLERELLFYVDASLHSRFIQDQGDAIILSDRGKWSHLAYLKGYLKTGQIDWDDYSLCKKFIERLCAEPEVVVYMRGSLELMKTRLASREKDAIESNGDTFFAAVLDTYEELVAERQNQAKPLIILDALDNTLQQSSSVVNYLKNEYRSAKSAIEGSR